MIELLNLYQTYYAYDAIVVNGETDDRIRGAEGFGSRWNISLTIKHIFIKMHYILVLGQRLNKNGTVPAMLYKRLEHAAFLFHYEYDTAIIVSGADMAQTGNSEAKIMAKCLIGGI